MPLLPPTIYDDTIVAIDTLRSNGAVQVPAVVDDTVLVPQVLATVEHFARAEYQRRYHHNIAAIAHIATIATRLDRRRYDHDAAGHRDSQHTSRRRG
ncbi:MAG: hypothetical protein KatS3mg038_2951 [Candidatus Kapaibacterium sp.]|nr:MAG: hypothetical protein KatS3mg038_2951 [Candidatus Kapabacteria bacterium]